eukprot:522889-Pleurochrysis_carterae.AAC.1
MEGAAARAVAVVVAARGSHAPWAALCSPADSGLCCVTSDATSPDARSSQRTASAVAQAQRALLGALPGGHVFYAGVASCGGADADVVVAVLAQHPPN